MTGRYRHQTIGTALGFVKDADGMLRVVSESELSRINQRLAASYEDSFVAKTKYERLASYGIKVSGDFDQDREVVFTYAGKSVICTTKEQIDDFVAFVEALIAGWE